jgi:arsenate reductase-like glutaredoxin family protein
MPGARITLFAVPDCPLCETARTALRACGEAFEERNPLSDRDAFMDAALAGSTIRVPTVVVGERVLVGFDKEKFEEMLAAPPFEPIPDFTEELKRLLRAEDAQPRLVPVDPLPEPED